MNWKWKKILSKLIISFKETKWWWQSIQPITQLIVIEFCHFKIVVSFFTLFISIMMMTMMMMTRLRRRRLCRCRGRRRRRLSSSSSKFFLFGLVQQSYHSDIVYSICVFSYHFLFQDSKDFFFKIFHCSQSIYSIHLCCLFSFHIITHNKQAQNRTEHTSYWIYFFSKSMVIYHLSYIHILFRKKTCHVLSDDRVYLLAKYMVKR